MRVNVSFPCASEGFALKLSVLLREPQSKGDNDNDEGVGAFKTATALPNRANT